VLMLAQVNPYSIARQMDQIMGMFAALHRTAQPDALEEQLACITTGRLLAQVLSALMDTPHQVHTLWQPDKLQPVSPRASVCGLLLPWGAAAAAAAGVGCQQQLPVLTCVSSTMTPMLLSLTPEASCWTQHHAARYAMVVVEYLMCTCACT
jgi:hypothetical protein